MSEVIAAVSRGVMSTLADGTLRVKIDIEPADAELAFKLLGMPGNPIAIARLAIQTAAIKPAEPEPERPKGGALAKLAGQWCQQPAFADWLAEAHGDIFDGALRDADGEVDMAATAVVWALCGIQSRAELDHDPVAAGLFHERIRAPYMAYLEGVPA